MKQLYDIVKDRVNTVSELSDYMTNYFTYEVDLLSHLNETVKNLASLVYVLVKKYGAITIPKEVWDEPVGEYAVKFEKNEDGSLTIDIVEKKEELDAIIQKTTESI